MCARSRWESGGQIGQLGLEKRLRNTQTLISYLAITVIHRHPQDTVTTRVEIFLSPRVPVCTMLQQVSEGGMKIDKRQDTSFNSLNELIRFC